MVGTLSGLSLNVSRVTDEPIRPLRVALVAPSPVPFKVPLYRRIAAVDGIHLTVIYGSSMGAARPAEAGYSEPVTWGVDLLEGYEAVFLKAASRRYPRAARQTEMMDLDVVTVLTRGRFDVMWSEGYNWITNMLAIATQRVRGTGVVLRDTQNLLHPRGLTKTVVKELALRRLLSQIDAAVYIGRENRRWLEHYGMPPERLFWSPYGPDSDYFSAEAERLRPDRDTLKMRFGFSPDVGPIVVSVARLAPMKQPAMLIEAFRRVRAQRRCGLLLVGSGPSEGELHERVERAGIPDVRFAGFLDQVEVPYAYAASDIFALLSAWGETFGVAVAEAMYFGLPLLLSDKVGSAADLLGDGANGYLVARDDLDEATRRLDALVADAERRERFGLVSGQRISEWTLDHAAEGAVSAIRFAADRSRAHRRERRTRRG